MLTMVSEPASAADSQTSTAGDEPAAQTCTRALASTLACPLESATDRVNSPLLMLIRRF